MSRDSSTPEELLMVVRWSDEIKQDWTVAYRNQHIGVSKRKIFLIGDYYLDSIEITKNKDSISILQNEHTFIEIY